MFVVYVGVKVFLMFCVYIEYNSGVHVLRSAD